MTLGCAILHKSKGLKLKQRKSTLNGKNFIRNCLGLSPAVSSQFSVEMCAAFKNCEKFTKNHFLRGSRSFKVIDVDKS